MRDMQLLIHATALAMVNKGPCGVAVLVQVGSYYSRIHMAKCLREQMFAGTYFRVLPFDREKHALQKFPTTQ